MDGHKTKPEDFNNHMDSHTARALDPPLENKKMSNNTAEKILNTVQFHPDDRRTNAWLKISKRIDE
uniref:Uncharacterized protein n=1 Tax=Romanomermis culicivorax TaxID=13658 RepID=A0A915HIM3_ROMCU